MLGALLGTRYKIIAVLGAGGFGRTFLAEDTEQATPTKCVVKQFKPANQEEKFLEIARRLFHQEVGILEKLGRHNQIPGFLNFFEENQEFYLVQEFIDGRSLNEEIASHRRMSETDAIALLRDVLHILDFVHANHVIHRDIKPGNLIRRHQDGKIVLIDFGAVKELRTQISTGSGQTGFTVSIGTPGYTPSEQLAGKPRFCSDIYALGITAIHALTGLQPSQLPEDPRTFEFRWTEYADVSPGLAFILSRMVRSHFSQRYQSAQDVLQALQRLSALPPGTTENLPALLLPESLLYDQFEEETRLDAIEPWQTVLKRGIGVVATAAIATAGLLLGIQPLGWLEPLERGWYDQMVRLHNHTPPDPRLLIVGISETDLQQLNRPTPSDQDLARVLTQIEQHQPRVIGLDLHRELPQEPGHAQLLQFMRTAANLIVIMRLGNPDTQIPPPPGVPSDRVGFNDFPVDSDGVVRRNLMFASLDEVYYSFSLRAALAYLKQENIAIQNPSDRPDWVQIGQTVFPPLTPSAGGYQQIDADGYQIMLDYQAATNVARQVSFTEVLNGELEPDWVKDKIVLIGTTAPSAKDLFYTPYSAAQETNHQMPGVVLHAQMVSQLLSSVLDQRSPIWFWSDWVEGLWIAAWAIGSGCVVWFIRRPLVLVISAGVLLVAIAGTSYLIFAQFHGWVPMTTPMIGSVLAGIGVAAYKVYWTKQRQTTTQFFE
jgi:CHASE2 domain-containing sensor protein/tRNA A-37 threonylcarbamoyl transferase component Bud32